MNLLCCRCCNGVRFSIKKLSANISFVCCKLSGMGGGGGMPGMPGMGGGGPGGMDMEALMKQMGDMGGGAAGK